MVNMCSANCISKVIRDAKAYIYCHNFHWSVRTCPGLDAPQHGSLSTERATVGTEVLVQCDPGFILENHTIQYTMVCTDDLVWNDTVTDCAGK